MNCLAKPCVSGLSSPRCARLPRIRQGTPTRPKWTRFLTGSVADSSASTSVSSASTSTTSTITKGADPFIAAARRLTSLLEGAGDGEEEMFNMFIAEQTPSTKIRLLIPLSAGVTIAAIVITTLCGRDPWGGLSFSVNSLEAAVMGVAVAVPFIVARRWSWTPSAYQEFPALEDMHLAQLGLRRSWLTGFSQREAFMLMALETLPQLLITLPAAQGGIVAALLGFSALLDGSSGLTIPEEAAQCLALLTTALMAAAGQSIELDVNEDEYDTVKDAMSNADRYYRLTAMDAKHGLPDALRATRAFQAVAQAWLETRGDACVLAGAIAFVDVVFLGGLWYWTHDLAAPLAAALCLNWIDTQKFHALVTLRERPGAAARTSQDGRDDTKAGP